MASSALVSSNGYQSLKSNITFFPEDNRNGIGVSNASSSGIFVPPSTVPGRPQDITGYVLTASGPEGKVQWAIAPGNNLSLGELIDVDLTGLNNGDVIIYDASINTWIPGRNAGLTPGIALSTTGNVLNVNVDNIAIGVNTLNQLQVNPSSITNSMLVNNSITINTTTGLTATPPSVPLGGTLNIGVDNTVLRTFGNQTITGDLEVTGLLTGGTITDGTLTINGGDINDVLSLSFVETGGGTDQITLSAPVTVSAGGYSLLLPQAQGAVNTVLTNDGFGNLSWVSPGSTGSPGGPLGAIQYHDPLNTFAGSANFLYDGTDVVLAGGEMSALAFNATSDVTLKENIVPLENCLEKVNAIEGYEYNWKNNVNRRKNFGVLSQQLQDIGLENITTMDSNGNQAVQYNQLIPLLIEAVKELTHKINLLENNL